MYEGITHVVERMDWYCALTERALNKDIIVNGNQSFESILQQLEKKIDRLYKACLLYQMKSVCSFYRNQGTVLVRGILNLDDWNGDLKLVTDAEGSLIQDLKQYHNMHGQSAMEELVRFGGKQQLHLGNISQDLREIKKMHMDASDLECLRGLGIVDPQAEMKRIESKKEELLTDAYNWILHTKEYEAFTSWRSDESGLLLCKLLWIKGHAGTGKTMLLIGIIRELANQQLLSTPNLAYFFCQDTDTTLNNATSALRSLIWMLLVQQPHLICHLREKYQSRGSALFSSFENLEEAFLKMLKDPELLPTYIIIDALDECDQTTPGRAQLFRLIKTSFTLTEKVKWLVSSRPEVNVHAELRNVDAPGTFIELGTKCLEGPVRSYIEYKLSNLNYDAETLAEVSEEVHKRASNIFLWVALVFKELDKDDESDAVEIIREIPDGLSELYGHMMTRIGKRLKRDGLVYYKNILVAASLAYRPLSLSELAIIADLPPKKKSRTLVDKCGSFLTVKDDTVYLIHQSAKDYLLGNDRSKVREGATVRGHADISRLSIKAISTLKRNIYDLPHPGFKLKDISLVPDLLTPIQYACVFWIDHLCEAMSLNLEYDSDLSDDGAIFAFFEKHLLHWLESLSLLGKFSDGILSIRKLRSTVQVCEPVLLGSYRTLNSTS
jgi:hypothetical protein